MKKFTFIFLLVLTHSLFSQVQLGLGLDGEAPGDEYGRAVSLSADGTIVAIGSDLNNGGGTIAGHVRVHQYSNGSWAQLGGDIDGESAFDQSGYAVSLSDNGLTLIKTRAMVVSFATNAVISRLQTIMTNME